MNATQVAYMLPSNDTFYSYANFKYNFSNQGIAICEAGSGVAFERQSYVDGGRCLKIKPNSGQP